MDVDFSELDKLAADLGEVPKNVGPKLRQALQQTSIKIKKDAQAKVKGRKLMGKAAAAIDYELANFSGFGASVLKSEIGYNKGKRSGRIGNLVEFGAPRAKAWMMVTKKGKKVWIPVPGKPAAPLRPGNELQSALKANEADFQKGLEIAIEQAQKASGL